jgi:hypothetical protein
MPLISFHPPRSVDPRSEQGFTLMEALVAMVTGVIVTGALLAILEFSLRQQSSITGRAQADQMGRTAMGNIVDELHSACTGATPIQVPNSEPKSPLAKSNGVNLWFTSAYGVLHNGEPLIEKVLLHDINWTAATETSSTGEQVGNLTDYRFESTSGSASTGWTFKTLSTAEATSAKILATNVIKPKSGSIFQYYKYESNSASATYGQLIELSSSELSALTETAAKNIAKVAINFTQAPEGEHTKAGNIVSDTRGDRTVSFSDSVVLRLDPTTTESISPCE